MNSYKPQVLTIGPGAEKGYYMLGVLEKLEKNGVLDNINYISCCSVGSIIAVPLAVGYKVGELIKEFVEHDTFSVLGQINLSNIFLQNGGLFKTDGLRELLERLLKKKIGYIPTMKSLYMTTGIEITIITTNLNSKNSEKFINHLTEPDLNCVDAILLSSALPVLLDGLEYKGDSMVDGAFSNPYPINVYDDGKKQCLGIYVDDQIYLNKVNNNFEKVNHIIHCMIDDKREKIIKRSSKKCFHLGIYRSNKIKNHYNPSLKDKEEMLSHGRSFAVDFLKKKNKKYIPVGVSRDGVPFLKKVEDLKEETKKPLKVNQLNKNKLQEL